MKLLTKRGQSTGEYAILFAIVLGAAIAMQSYVRNRIAGKLQAEANAYAAGVPGVNLARTSDSRSAQSAAMTTARDGQLISASDATQRVVNPE